MRITFTQTVVGLVLLALPAIFLLVATLYHPPPRAANDFDAILPLGGGQLPDFTPPPHVELRLRRAAALYFAAPGEEVRRPMIITTSRGTPHKPSPHDAGGYEIDEADMQARHLITRYNVPSSAILEENLAQDTIGNAYFARLLHTDVDRSLRRLAIITNRWHMNRSKAVFDHVFSLPTHAGAATPGYELSYFSEADALPADVLTARLAAEAKKLPNFGPGSAWREATPTMAALHRWINTQHGAYAVKRLINPKWHARENGSLTKSYRA